MNDFFNLSSKEQSFVISNGLDTLKHVKQHFLSQVDHPCLPVVHNDSIQKNDETKTIIKNLQNELKDQKKMYHEVNVNYIKNFTHELDRHSIGLKNRILLLEDRLLCTQNLLKSRDNEIKELEKKYNLPGKGIIFEIDIYNALLKINENELNNVWKISHVGQNHHHKGDIILEHKEKHVRVMLDPKNVHECVTKQNKDKFILDVLNKNNNFDIGVLVSRGKINACQNFELVKDNGKIFVFISFFQVGQEHFLLSILQYLLVSIYSTDDNRAINLQKIRQYMIQEYNFMKKKLAISLQDVETYKEYINTLTSNFFELYEEDIALISKQKCISHNESTIFDFFQENLKLSQKDDDKIKIKDIFNIFKIKEEFSTVNSSLFIKCLNTWLKKNTHEISFKQVRMNSSLKAQLKL